MNLQPLRRLVFAPALDRFVVDEPDARPTSANAESAVEFVAFAEGCRLSGWTRLEGERLTDMLNGYETFDLVDVLGQPFDQSESASVTSLQVSRNELVAVYAHGPRGNPGRRQRTRPYPIAFKSGRVLVCGYVHTLPGADALAAISRRPPMLPLTDAVIEYRLGGEFHRGRADVVVVNRPNADWISPWTADDREPPELVATTATGRLLKDLTGTLLGDHAL